MLPCIILAVLAPILGWVFGLSVNAKALIAFAVSGLIVTAVGVVLIVGALYLAFFASASWFPPPPPQTHSIGRVFFLLGVIIGVMVEILGGILTLASCFMGLRQTARQRPRWFWILLAGALVPLIASIGIGVFAQAFPDMFGQVSPRIHGMVSVLLLIPVALPLIAAIVTLTYAVRGARGAHGQPAAAPLPAAS